MNTKIYYILNARMPTERAHGIQVAKMYEAMRGCGMDVTMILPRRKNAIHDSWHTYYGLATDVSVIQLGVWDMYTKGRIGFVMSSCTFMVAYIWHLLKRKFSGEHFIVYTIDMDQFSFAGVPLLRVPYFVEIHDAKPRSLMYRWLFRFARGIITINQPIKQALIDRFGLRPESIIVHPNGIDLSWIRSDLNVRDARKSLGIPLNKYIVLYSGKFYDWKGLDILISAARVLGTQVDIYIIGGTPEELQKVTGELLPENLHCMGQVPYATVPKWLAAADTLLLLGTKKNTYSYNYTSPMKLFEYMAARRVIVASGTPAVREIVGGSDVLLYAPDDTSDLAKKILSARNLPAHEKDRMITSAYQRVTIFTWKDRARSVQNFISHA